MKLILTLALVFSSTVASAQSISCGAFISQSDTSTLLLNTIDHALPDPVEAAKANLEAETKAAIDVLAELEVEALELKPTDRLISQNIRALNMNRRLKRERGGYSDLIKAQRTAQIARLSSALKDGARERVWSTVNKVMLKTELDAIWLNHRQKKIKALNRALAELPASETTAKIKIELAFNKWRAHRRMKSLHTNYILYRAFRDTFQRQIDHGRTQELKDFAAEIFSTTGLDNPILNIQLPSSLGVEPGQRPSIDFIKNEYHASNFADGTPRHLAGLSLIYKLKRENTSMIWHRFTSFFKVTLTHTALDILSEKLRKLPKNTATDKVIKAIDWITKDTQNIKALKEHLTEIDFIASLNPSRQYGAFEIALKNFSDKSSFMRSQEFNFLTSLARAHGEYKATWNRIHWTTALRNVNALPLIDKMNRLQREMRVQEIALDSVIQAIEDKGDFLTVDPELAQQEKNIITEKSKLETQIKAVETQIGKKIDEFKALANNATAASVHPDLKSDLQLFAEMEKANEREVNMGPLSFDSSPGTEAKYTAYSIIAIYLGVKLYRDYGGPEFAEKTLEWLTSYTFEDIESLVFIEAPGAAQQLIQAVQNSGAL